MKKRILPLAPICALLAATVLAAASVPDPVVSISRIQVQPGAFNTRLVMESDGPLSIENIGYLPGSPRTLVLDVNQAQALQVPSIPSSEAQFIRDIQVQKAGANDVRFFIELGERVPCRLISEAGRTVLEFTKIQRSKVVYSADPETQARLDGAPRREILLSKLDYSQSADAVTFKASLSDQAVAQVFALENPARLVVDLFDTVLAAKADMFPVSNPAAPVQRMRVAQFQSGDPRSITRMVFDLKEPGLYQLDSRKDGLVVSFFSSSPAPVQAAPKPETPAASAIAEPKPMQAAVVSTPAPSNPAKTAEAKPAAAALEKKASSQPPAIETACPPREAGPPPQEQKTAQAQVVSEDKFKPKTIVSEEEKYSGEVISLRFKDADLRDVVLYLSEFAGLNVVFDPDVRGTVTCDLRDLPWDQALDIVLRQNKMGKAIEGNVLRIAPINALMREEEEQRKLKESRELAGPVQVKTITLSYSKAKDVSALIRSKLSTRGEIIIDDRTNTLLITDVKDRIDLIEKLISVVDTPTPQVSIEARIVEATATFIRNLGIQWGFKGISDPFYGNATSVQFPNKVLVDGALIPQGVVTKGIGGPLGGYAINLPAPAFNTAIGFSFANVLDTFRLDMALSALETAGEGRIISLPKVTTQNNQQAEIIQGRQIPVQTVANFTVTTRYVNAALELRATPQITAEGTIIMTVEIQNNAADFANLVNGIPPITTQSAKTTVMVPDGGTTVIGGIYRTEDSVTRERVPFLNQIPVLGGLFRNFARTKQQRELLIFITPRIVR
jgi:type IV pilus assembly protein PilQ